jgi:AraC family transcriptional regulator
MRQNPGSPLTLESIANEVGLSRFHLVRMFKRADGDTIFERLTRLRMDEARRLLRRGDESVMEIALQCGYENPAHFAAAFRRHVGVTPRSYRSRT